MGRQKRINHTKEAEKWIASEKDPPGFKILLFPNKGRGIVTMLPRNAGDFLLQYAGEVIPAAEGEIREQVSTGFRFFYSSAGKQLCIDASEETGRLGRLVNHGKKQERNAKMKELHGQLCLFAIRDIEVGEEVTYDYGLKELPWEKLTTEATGEVKKEEKKAVMKPEGKKPELVLKIKAQTLEEGDQADFNCEVIGEPKPEIKWFHNGQELKQEGRYLVAEEETVYHLKITDIVPEDVGGYMVVAENSFGKAICIAQLQVIEKPKEEVKKLEAPTFVMEIQKVEKSVNEKANFYCKAKGNPKPKILWYKEDKQITKEDTRFTIEYGDDDSSLLIIDVLPEHNGKYMAEAKNKVGQTTCKAELFVHEKEKKYAPEIIKSPSEVVTREHQRAQFLIKVIGHPSPTVTWTKENVALTDVDLYHLESNENTYCLEVKDTTIEDTGVYTCVAENEVGKATCDIPLEVIEKEKKYAPEIIKSPSEVVTREHQRAQFLIKVIGHPSPTVTWTKENVALTDVDLYHLESNENTYCLEVKDTTIEDTGVYTCVAENEVGKATCDIPLEVIGIDDCWDGEVGPDDMVLSVVNIDEVVSDSECSDVVPEQGPIWIPDVDTCMKPDSTTENYSTGQSKDVKLQEIVIQSVESSNKRNYGKMHCCFFCKKNVIKMARHLEKSHKNVPEIARLPPASSNPENSSKRMQVFSKYRNLGDFNHNVEVLKEKKGVFFVGRRPAIVNDAVTHTARDYLPCQFCLTFYVKTELWRHVNTCPFKENNISIHSDAKDAAEDCIRSAQYTLQGALGSQDTSENRAYIENVVNRFHVDDVSCAIKSDKLLMLFGKVQLRKLGIQKASQVREKLRILGRLKLELRSVTGLVSADIDDFITPKEFDNCLMAIGHLCQESSEGSLTQSKTFEKPSLALKAGQLLKKIAVVKRGQAIRNQAMTVKDDTDHFLNLYNEEFTETVSSLAHHSLSERKYNKKVLLPLTEDLVKYVNYLETTMVEQTRLIQECPCPKHWNALAEVTVARVILFNKRRASEGSKMLMSQFLCRPAWGRENQELVSTLQPIERQLMKTMSLVEVVGKQYKRVPVLLTQTMVASIQALIDLRTEGGVKTCNPHVFAQGDDNIKRGSDCIRRTVERCSLQCPERITSTKLRKYLATVSQIFNLSETELGELARHMGHELSVHRRFYRLQDDVIELAKMSRLLLAIEEGNAAQFAGCSLDDINLEEFVAEDVAEKDAKQEEDNDEQDIEMFDENEESLCPSRKRTSQEVNQSDNDEESAGPSSVKKGGSSVLKRTGKEPKKREWSKAEKELMKQLVDEAVRKKRPPRKGEVVLFQAAKADEKLKELAWIRIKYQVWAMAQAIIKEKEKIVKDLMS